jgi:hypothetical protein
LRSSGSERSVFFVANGRVLLYTRVYTTVMKLVPFSHSFYQPRLILLSSAVRKDGAGKEESEFQVLKKIKFVKRPSHAGILFSLNAKKWLNR